MSLLPASSIGDESTGFYNGAVEQSGRFFGTTGYIDHLFSTPTSTQKMILAFWVKPSEFGDKQNIFGGGASSTNYVSLSFSNSGFYNANDQLKLLVVNSNSNVIIKITNRLFRDPSAWMHVCVAIDTTQDSADDRVLLYFNGIKYTGGYASEHNPSENQNLTQINSAMYHQIGLLYAGANYGHFDGYLADFYFLDGQSIYSDTSQTINSTFLADADTLATFCEQKNGVAIPKAYTGATSTYGNNGFRLEFKNTTAGGSSPSSSTFGADTSGKNNHFNDYGGTSTWQGNCLDSPENNFCTLNPLGKQSASALSEGGLKTIITSGTNSGRTPGTFAVNSGKWYWEVRQSSSNRFGMGVFDTDRYVMANEDLGSDAFEWGYITSDNSGSGAKRNSNTIVNGYGGETANGHVVMVALDVDNEAIWFGKQGSWFNTDGSSDSATVKSQIEAGTTTNAAYTSVSGRLTPSFVRQTSNNTLHVNFGQDDTFGANETAAGNTDGNGNGKFQYEPPSGFLALCSSNLPDVDISPAKSTQADDHFNAFIYTGDGTSNKDFALNTFTPDLVWLKARTTTDNNVIVDSSRVTGTHLDSSAVYPNLHSNTVDAETSDSHPKIIANGIQVSGGLYNNNNIGFVVWNWKANGGTTTTNNAGSNGADITGVIQANTTAGFSIVTFTGNDGDGTNNLIAHGLGKAPAFYIVKDRDTNSAGRWMVYHHGLGIHHGATRDNLFLELTNASNAQGFGSSDDNTSVLFEPAVTTYNNNSGSEYVAYVWTEIEGYSKFGAYHGNGESNNFIHLGFRPKLLVIKRVDTASVLHNWYVVDSVRSTINPIDFGDILCWDKAFIEGKLDSGAGAATVSGEYIDFCSTGFNCKTGSTGFNNGSGKYVYMAWAEQPFKFSNAR